jgi:hypothetical protein
MLNLFKQKSFHWLAVCSLLGGSTVGLQVLAQAQGTPLSISLINVVNYYTGLPHQDRAIWLLQSQIDKMQPNLLAADSIMANVWRDSDTLVGHVNVLEQIPAADRVGADPFELAIANSNLRTGAPVDIELLSGPNVEAPDQVMVTVTAGGLLDDSVAGIRYRFDIELQNGQWEIQRAGQQFRCQPGRGHQDWSDDTCL